MAKKLTILDIAHLAGVSKSTVSRVLNQNPHVDLATRQLVLQIMHEYGFVPSINATGLRGRSQLVGLFVPSLRWPLAIETISGIADFVESTPYEIVLCSSQPEKGHQDVIDRMLTTKFAAGLLVITHTQDQHQFLHLSQYGHPIVLVNTVSWRIDIPWVGADNRGGAYIAVRHLLNLGHRRIAHIHGDPIFPCSAERYEGYCQALQEAGLPIDADLVYMGDFNISGGRQGAAHFFALDDPPTAIFAANDNMAYGVLAVAEEQGISIPAAVSVVGFDDNIPSAHTRPALTTVRQPFAEMGRCAAQLLLSLLDPQYPFPADWEKDAQFVEGLSYTNTQDIEGKEYVPPHIQLPTHLVVRDSCRSFQHVSV